MSRAGVLNQLVDGVRKERKERKEGGFGESGWLASNLFCIRIRECWEELVVCGAGSLAFLPTRSPDGGHST